MRFLVATRGGAISFTGGNDSLIVTNSIVMGTVTAVNTVSNNDAGAIYAATNRSVSITDSTISGSVTGSSSGANYGGAVYQNSGTLNLTNCTISGSSVTGAKGNGGAFDIQGGTANLSGCTITGNTASNNGGGVYVGRGTLNATNCTITGNTATNKGGGVAAFFYSSNSQNGTAVTNLTNCTISGNTATSGGGLYVGYHPHSTTTSTNTVTVNNTIVAGGLVRQTGGVITDTKEKLNVSNSLFDTTPTTGAGNTINGTNANNLFGTNPMLGSLASNGGTTQTLALLSGSAAIDAGSNTLASSLTTDQRGFHRFVNGVVDIGAYEYQPAAALAPSSSDSPSTSGQSVTFTATLSVVTGSNTPTGSVTFSIDGVAAGTVALNGLSATFLTSSLSVGSHTVTASFNNATPFPPSTSSSLTQLVNAAPATGNPSYAVSADAGGGPQVNVYNAATGALVDSFDAFAPSFTGGVRVAIGDVNGDGQDDIICAAGPGGGPQVERLRRPDLPADYVTSTPSPLASPAASSWRSATSTATAWQTSSAAPAPAAGRRWPSSAARTARSSPVSTPSTPSLHRRRARGGRRHQRRRRSRHHLRRGAGRRSAGDRLRRQGPRGSWPASTLSPRASPAASSWRSATSTATVSPTSLPAQAPAAVRRSRSTTAIRRCCWIAFTLWRRDSRAACALVSAPRRRDRRQS